MRFKPKASQRATAQAMADTGRTRKWLAAVGALLLVVLIAVTSLTRASRSYMTVAASDEVEAVGDHDHGRNHSRDHSRDHEHGSAGKEGKQKKSKGKKGKKGKDPSTSAEDEEGRCHERPVYTRSLTVEQAAARSPDPAYTSRPSCRYELEPSVDVVMGVWHCMAYESTRLKVLMEAWAGVKSGPKLNVVFLASEVARGRSIYPDEMMIYSDTGGDDTYPSHVTKGMMGLVHMAEKFPAAKWYAVLGDDVAVSAGNLVNLLSAFDPEEEWCLGQLGALTDGSWRLFGGAPIITSRAMTQRLMGPIAKNEAVYRAMQNQPHDLVFSELVGTNAGGLGAMTHVHGLYSMPPGPYMHCPTMNGGFCPPHEAEHGRLPDGIIHRFPAAFHDIKIENYMRFMHTAFEVSARCESLVSLGQSSTDPSIQNVLDSMTVGVHDAATLSKVTGRTWPAMWGAGLRVVALLGPANDFMQVVKSLLGARTNGHAWLVYAPSMVYMHPQVRRDVGSDRRQHPAMNGSLLPPTFDHSLPLCPPYLVLPFARLLPFLHRPQPHANPDRAPRLNWLPDHYSQATAKLLAGLASGAGGDGPGKHLVCAGGCYDVESGFIISAELAEALVAKAPTAGAVGIATVVAELGASVVSDSNVVMPRPPRPSEWPAEVRFRWYHARRAPRATLARALALARARTHTHTCAPTNPRAPSLSRATSNTRSPRARL